MSSQQDFLANHSPWPGSSEARLMTVTSGLKLFGSSRTSNLLGSLVKTCLALPSWASTKCHLIWKVSVTPSNRLIFRLAPSMPRTDGQGSGFLPTPSGTSSHGKNHVVGRLDEWGGSSNPFRGTDLGKMRLPTLEEWMMGYPEGWSRIEPMPSETPSSPRSQK